MTKTRMIKRTKRTFNKSKRKYLKKRGGNVDVNNLFINPLTTIGQMAGLIK